MRHRTRWAHVHMAFALLILGFNMSAWGLVNPLPVPITYGETVHGSLDATDPTFTDGRHYDQYTFEVETPGKSYVLTIKSDVFATWGMLAVANGSQLQTAYVFQPGAQVQFSGILEQLGQYTILVSNSDHVPVIGSYTLTLSDENTVSYYGTVIMEVWYKKVPSLHIPPQHKIYQQNVKVQTGPPLQDDYDMIEQNPFYYKAVSQDSMRAGSFSITSASLYRSEQDKKSRLIQDWWYMQQGERYQGTFQPLSQRSHAFNLVFLEDPTDTLPICVASIEPGATIDIEFNGNQMTTKIIGTVYDPGVPQPCTSYIERLEMTIEAVRVAP